MNWDDDEQLKIVMAHIDTIERQATELIETNAALLAALELMMQRFGTHFERTEWSYIHDEEALEKARAAIALAKD